jgi:hypothetical protein
VTEPLRDGVDAEWRNRMLSFVEGGSVDEATDALLSLTNHDPDREWVEKLLIRHLDAGYDHQIRRIAVVCIGHLARILTAINEETVALLRQLTNDSLLGGSAEDALDDIQTYVRPV